MRYTIGSRLLTLLAPALLLTACSDDGAGEDAARSLPLQLVGTDRQVMLTRADNTQSYADYDAPDGTVISLYLTQASSYAGGSFTRDGEGWQSMARVTPATTYTIYGFMPQSAVQSAGIAAVGDNYATGAVLTLTLPVVSAADVCLISGVQGVESSSVARNVQRGAFSYTAVDGADKNNVHLLFDHVYAALQFQFRLNADYAQLRKIQVKELALESTYTTATATLTVTPNATGANPVAATYGTPASGASATATPFYQPASPLELTTSYQTAEASGYFLPQATVLTGLTLVTTYDVLDRYDNKVREDCISRNSLDGLIAGLQAGDRKVIKLTVNPTYLYQLSEPDLDNPTIRFEN